jgi:hypothetical protein
MTIHIWTDHPIEEIWNQLRALSSSENVYGLLTGRKSSNRTTKLPEADATRAVAREIAALIRQADEYFRSSLSVSMNTRPLLQYYGVQCLTKVILLTAENPSGSFRYHGLTSDGSKARPSDIAAWLTAYRETPEAWRLESEFSVVKGGIFRDLMI